MMMGVGCTYYHEGKKLSQNELRDFSNICPICLSEHKRKPVLMIQDKPRVDLLYCDVCRGLSASHMPTSRVLEEYYSHYYKNPASQKVTTPDVSGFSRHIIGYLDLAAIGAKISILDYGGGDGSISASLGKTLADMGYTVDITVVDIQNQQVPSSSVDIPIRYEKDIFKINGRFDLIIASAIFEHIPELNPVIRHIASLAGEGCYFYSRTPYAMPLIRIFPFLDLTYPGHVHDLGPSFWNRFTETFHLRADTMVSQPSPVETSFKGSPLRTIIATLFKLPSHVESRLFPSRADPMWNLVGGWEIILRFRDGITVNVDNMHQPRP
jgi:hypothetical protein